MMKPALWKASTRSLLRECQSKSILWLIAEVVLLLLTCCVMIDTKQSVFGLKSKCFFFWWGVSTSSGIEPVHDKYLPLRLAGRFLEAIEHIWFHLSLNVNDYRDSESVALH